MSALPPKADMLSISTNVRLVPIADIRRCGSNDALCDWLQAQP